MSSGCLLFRGCSHTEVNRRTVRTNLSVSAVVGCPLTGVPLEVSAWATVVHDWDFYNWYLCCAGPKLLIHKNLKYNSVTIINNYVKAQLSGYLRLSSWCI